MNNNNGIPEVELTLEELADIAERSALDLDASEQMLRDIVALMGHINLRERQLENSLAAATRVVARLLGEVAEDTVTLATEMLREEYLRVVEKQEPTTEFTCAKCHTTFDTKTTEEEAVATAIEDFGEKVVEHLPMHQVCESCYKELMAEYNDLTPQERQDVNQAAFLNYYGMLMQ